LLGRDEIQRVTNVVYCGSVQWQPVEAGWTVPDTRPVKPQGREAVTREFPRQPHVEPVRTDPVKQARIEEHNGWPARILIEFWLREDADQ
jgi:hypothetical protein